MGHETVWIFWKVYSSEINDADSHTVAIIPNSQICFDFIRFSEKAFLSYLPCLSNLVNIATNCKLHPFLSISSSTLWRRNNLFPDPASGGSEDWAKHSGGVKYVYLLELRPDEKSKHTHFIISVTTVNYFQTGTVSFWANQNWSLQLGRPGKELRL